MINAPHFLLFSESKACDGPTSQWRFVLESIDGKKRVSASDQEITDSEDRAELLAVVRGLEALDSPSRVTLVTKNRYVSKGFRRGLTEWRNSAWRWEHFGRSVPIRNADLWQRIDHALQFHHVECRMWRFDVPEEIISAPQPARTRKIRIDVPNRTKTTRQQVLPRTSERVKTLVSSVTEQCQRLCGSPKLRRA